MFKKQAAMAVKMWQTQKIAEGKENLLKIIVLNMIQ